MESTDGLHRFNMSHIHHTFLRKAMHCKTKIFSHQLALHTHIPQTIMVLRSLEGSEVCGAPPTANGPLGRALL